VKAIVAFAIAACGSSSSPPSTNEVAPKPVSAETRIDAAVHVDAAGNTAVTTDEPAEPACDPDDPRCTAPLESGKPHPRPDPPLEEPR
jgi:hypothetical protein